MSDRSFVRAGAVAGILLALTSWAAVAVYYTFVPTAQQQPIGDTAGYLASVRTDSVGQQLFFGLYGLVAMWALVGTIALYYRIRAAGEAWAFFAMLVGAVAAFLTVVANVYEVARLRTIPEQFVAPSAVNPLNVVTFGLTAPWFLVTALLMRRAGFPTLLAILGGVAFADLGLGFAAALAGAQNAVVIAAAVAGAVGGPIFWLWLGVLLWRD